MPGGIKEAPAAATVPPVPIISNAAKNRRNKHSSVLDYSTGEFLYEELDKQNFYDTIGNNYLPMWGEKIDTQHCV